MKQFISLSALLALALIGSPSLSQDKKGQTLNAKTESAPSITTETSAQATKPSDSRVENKSTFQHGEKVRAEAGERFKLWHKQRQSNQHTAETQKDNCRYRPRFDKAAQLRFAETKAGQERRAQTNNE